jgi:methyl-accepting chemotaxis protein
MTIGISIFLLINLNKDISKLSLELEQIKISDEIRQNNINHENEIRDGIKDVLEKLKIGGLEYKIEKIPNDSNSAEITKLLNESMDKFNQDIDYALEYGNANFSYDVKTDNLSGKTGSLSLGIRVIESSVSEFIALINLTANSLNTNVEILSNASNSLSLASNEQAT